MGKTVDYRQIPKIQQYLNDESIEVRRAAISSLEQQWPTGDPIGILALIRKLQDSDAEVRAIASLAIGEFIPCAKTRQAKEIGSDGIKGLLKLLETEQDENVLEKIFIALGNIDDSSLIPLFTEVVKKLKLPAIYLGIRNISLLRATNTRQEMLNVLKDIETELDNQSNSAEDQDISEYQGKRIINSNKEVLLTLEKQIGKSIPIVTKVIWNTFGAVIENKQVVELGLNNIEVNMLPENIGQLNALRVFRMDKVAKIKALPDSFGNLKSLKEIIIDGRYFTSLPESIVKFNNIRFLNISNMANTSISDNVANWLRKQPR